MSSQDTLGTSNAATPTSDESSHLEAIAAAFQDKIHQQNLIQDRKYRLQTYQNVLVGKDAVSALVEVLQERGYNDVSRDQALKLGLEINQQFQILRHVTGDHELKDEKLFYRLYRNLPSQVEQAKKEKTSWDIMDMLERNVDIQDRVYHFRTYTQCFVGREAVDVILKLKLAMSREEAVELVLDSNREVHSLEHVTRDHDFADAFLFFRFIPQNERLLNPHSERQNLGALFDALVAGDNMSEMDSSANSSFFSLEDFGLTDNGDARSDDGSLADETSSSRKARRTDSGDSVSSRMSVTSVLSLLPPHTTLEDIAKALERDLPVKDHRYRFTVYNNCFIAKDAVSYMVRVGFASSRSRAELIGRQLQSHLNLFHHVTNDHKFRDKYYFFRFTPLEKRKTLVDMSTRNSGSRISISQDVEMPSGVPMRGLPPIPSGRSLHNSQQESSKLSIAMELEAANINMEEIAVAFERGMKVKDRVYYLKTYHNAFTGPQAIKFLVKKGFAETRQDAMLLGRLLAEEYFVFEHVGNSDIELIDCPTTMYQLVGPEDRKARIEVRQQRQGEVENLDDTASDLQLLPDDKQEETQSDVDPELQKIGALFRQGVKIKHHHYHGKVYQNTFVGSQAVDFLVNSSISDSRREAVQLGRRLMHELKQFDHVTRSHDFTDDYKFYRFEEHRTTSQGKHQSRISGIVGQVLHDSSQALQGSLIGLGSSIILPSRQSMEGSNITPALSRDFSGGTDFLPLEEIARAFRKHVKVKDRRYRFSTYKDVFVGSDAVDYLVGKTTWASSRKEAVHLGRTLMGELDLFQHVTKSHTFMDDEIFYRFTDEDEESMLDRLIALTEDEGQPFVDHTGSMTPHFLISAARAMEEGLSPRMCSFRLRVYKDCLIGSEIVTFLVDQGLAKSRPEAVQLGRAVAKQFMLFYHVTMDHLLKDSNLFYRFTTRDKRGKGKWFDTTYGDMLRNKMMKAGRRKHLSVEQYWNLVAEAVDKDVWDVQSSMIGSLRSFKIESDDTEWTKRVRTFERSVSKRAEEELRRSAMQLVKPDVSRVNLWASTFIRLDPRQQIHRFYNEVAQTGACIIEKDNGGDNRESVRAVTLKDFRPLFRFLPINLASVFSVWRPTSYDAIRKMMMGDAVGKGLDIKGKSAKRGKLSGFVPFLQIGSNKHKKQVRRLSPNHMVKVFYGSECRRARDVATAELEKVLLEMIDMVKEAKKVLASGDKADKEIHNNALEIMLLDVADPTITPIDDFAPECYGIEMPERLFWEAFFVRQDCTRKPGSIYDSGRPSQPAFQDMNFGALRSKPQEGAPVPVVYQNADRDDPMNPFEMLMAYEEDGRVRPVVSDFDCFLVGTRRVQYNMPLPSDQQAVLKWCMTQIERVANRVLRDAENGAKERKPWSLMWLEILKEESSFHPDIPRFGFADPVSYSIVANAVERLTQTGAVRHGAECFNYYFPQDLDDEFLVVSESIGEGNVPWKYVGIDELQDILAAKIDEGFCFPLNPKWVVMDPGFMQLYSKLLRSPLKNVQDAMNIWFPPESGLREDIERIYEIQKQVRKLEKESEDHTYEEIPEHKKQEMMYFL
ncbi:Rac exchanger 2 protein [Seminavis robusta]|uniref:Rac exchanger 2 protein n=1 Tax=Seminavis robusta TaxID=568900 RepID=A0A9N8H1R5_9STRA|nr:Rac exchanger 2 protein [Seminavis robusta]|eukprot:Sro21_g014920.1 Rac exchanger 2 protein (1574) ;mRNA; r:138841-143744